MEKKIFDKTYDNMEDAVEDITKDLPEGTEIEIVDRYSALGIPRPGDDCCKGQCEGTGFVPIHRDHENDEEGPWHDLWLECEKESPTDDGYHFVTCPRCKGKRVEPEDN